MATIRKQILLSEAQNERLRKLRAATGVSESEIVRRALEAYDPRGGADADADDEIREALAALVEQNAKTARALESAEAEIAATERYLRELRAERTGEHGTDARAELAPARARSAKPRRRNAAGGSR
ncbi:MAG TPA: ribbon-helix-helix protein, CopG family [Gammaproteobacteria bacterium]